MTLRPEGDTGSLLRCGVVWWLGFYTCWCGASISSGHIRPGQVPCGGWVVVVVSGEAPRVLYQLWAGWWGLHGFVRTALATESSNHSVVMCAWLWCPGRVAATRWRYWVGDPQQLPCPLAFLYTLPRWPLLAGSAAAVDKGLLYPKPQHFWTLGHLCRPAWLCRASRRMPGAHYCAAILLLRFKLIGMWFWAGEVGG